MARRAKFSGHKAYPADIVVLDFTVADSAPVQMGAVRLDRRSLKETAAFHSLIQPPEGEQHDTRALRGTGLDPEELARAPVPRAVLDDFEKTLLSGAEGGRKVILAMQDAAITQSALASLLEAGGREPNRYGERTLELKSIAHFAQGTMGLRVGGAPTLDAEAEALGVARPAARGALLSARFGAEVLRAFHQLGLERQRGYEVAALDPELLALVRDIEGRPNVQLALREFVKARTAAGGGGRPTLRERLPRLFRPKKEAGPSKEERAAEAARQAAEQRRPRAQRRHPPREGGAEQRPR